MNRNAIINGVLCSLLLALTAFSSLAQQPKEPFLEAAQRAGLALHKRDFDAAVRFYIEAITLFPKIDAFTPQNKKLKMGDGKIMETPYLGLDGLYLGWAKAYLGKRNLKEAETDYANALTVIKFEIKKNLDLAKGYRENTDIKKERENKNKDLHSNGLARAAFTYGVALRACEKAKWFNMLRRKNYQDLEINLTTIEQDIAGFDEVAEYEEKAFFGKTEALVTSTIDTGNNGHSFYALQSSDELVAAFPNSIEVYRLRARINRHWNREEAALADERKVKQLSGQK